jgi:hypothetical protein
VLTKVYFALWGVLALTAAVIFITGNMTMLALVVFGAFSFGLVFMGMMGVLPILVTHPEMGMSQKAPKPAKKPVAREAAARVGSSVAGWFDTKGVSVQKPKYP